VLNPNTYIQQCADMHMIEMGDLRIPVPDELHKALKLEALKQNKTLKQLVVEILEEGIKNEG